MGIQYYLNVSFLEYIFYYIFSFKPGFCFLIMGMFSKLKETIVGERIVYYPGCKAIKLHTKNYKEILSKLNVNFISLDMDCCGFLDYTLGYDIEFRKLARKNLNFLKEKKVDKIITSCPSCYYCFKKYREILPDWDIQIEFISSIIFERIGKIEVKEAERIGYHDCCFLGRYGGIYKENRKILENLGYEVIEMQDNREESFCVGNLNDTNPELARKIADRIIKHAKQRGINKIVVSGKYCFSNLQNNKIKIVEFSQAVLDALELLK